MARPYLGGTNVAIKAISSATTLTIADSGKTILLDGSSTEDAILVVTLPACSTAKGCEYTFFLKAIGNEATEDIDIVTDSASDDFVGCIVDGAGTSDTAADSNLRIRFDQSGGATAGEYIRMICDGTDWYTYGICNTAGDVVFMD